MKTFDVAFAISLVLVVLSYALASIGGWVWVAAIFVGALGFFFAVVTGIVHQREVDEEVKRGRHR